MVSLYKLQVSAFAKDSETAVLWMMLMNIKEYLRAVIMDFDV